MSTATYAGKPVEINDEGFLVHPEEWSEAMAPELAKTVGIETLSDSHWKVIRFMRTEYQRKGEIPTVRRIKNDGGVGTKELYQLFPEGPAKKAAKIAGLGKPQGCV